MPAESRLSLLGDSVKPASGDAIRLYHFTALEYLDAILAEGLTRGDVPLRGAFAPGVNAVWLTRNGDPEAQLAWTGDGPTVLTDEDRHRHAKAFGVLPPPGARYPNKRAVILEVDVPKGDARLVQWLRYARLRGVKTGWLRALKSSPDWYIYRGSIPPEWFADVAAISDRARAVFADRLRSHEDVIAGEPLA